MGRSLPGRKIDTIEDINYNLAHELAHSYLHYDKGDILPSAVDETASRQYEEQAERGARMLLDAIVAGMEGGVQ